MKRNFLTTVAALAGICLVSQQIAHAQGNLTDTQFGGGNYSGSGQGYYGGYGQGYGSYGSGYSAEYAPGYPSLSQQSYEPYRNDVLPNRSYVNPATGRSYTSPGLGRYGAEQNLQLQSPYYSGYGYGVGSGPGLYYGTYGTMNQRIDGFGGSGDHYYRKGSPYSRF